MEKQYEVRVAVACTVEAESEDEAKEKVESFMNELTGPHSLSEITFQVESAECQEDEDEED